MAAGSIVLGLLAFLFMGAGILTTPIPVLGTVLSFAAPALALAAVVTGGVAMSRAKRQGTGTEAATAGVVVGALAFVPALMVALTCGVCNALCSASTLQGGGPVRFHVGSGPDAAAPFGANPAAQSRPAPAAARDAGLAAEPAAPGDPSAPPPAFPPPPL